MPLYEVHHVIPLTEAQKDALADGITTIHSEKFTTPRMFVNVSFADDAGKSYYVAGKKRSINGVIANVRTGGGRTHEMFDEVCLAIDKLWAKHVGTTGDKELRGIFVYGNIIGGLEAGMPVPKAGEDLAWLKKHIGFFKQKAADGDEEFADLLKEIQSRGMGADAGVDASLNGH